ncbi:MAG: GGDEF domain-containing protein [Burkholderiaceae bacterium]|nr:GGDEF domain-containing protein [Burkholderiaceae bacterium]
MNPHRLPSLLLRLWLLVLVLLAPTGGAWAGTTLVLDDEQPRHLAWPVVRVLGDAEGTLDLAEALQRRREFQAPAGPEGNLGVRRDVVWLLLPLRVQSGNGKWLLDIDYPPLNHVQVTLLRDGRPLLTRQLGNAQPFDERPLRVRPHAMGLVLEPGVDYELLLRVQTSSSMLLPISLVKAEAFHEQESRTQLQQGLLGGLALALLLYSLAHWASLREAIFLWYAVMLVGVGLFFVAYFGIGQQHLWNSQAGALDKIAPQAILLALVGGALFVRESLGTVARSPGVDRTLIVLAALSGLGLLASLAGLLDYRGTQTVATLLGPLPLLVTLPAACRMAWQGDRVALYLLLGWSAYTVGALCTASLLRGWLPVSDFTQHLFQYSSALEMVLWTRVLGVRIEGVRLEAQRSALEKAALMSLAHTDALTGLPNRRGLNQALAQALPQGRSDSAVAVFLLDLDGFKPVNDRHGHDVGDELLKAVAQRLKRTLRASDLVSRLGGDEFVVMACGLAGEAEAMALGRKLLDAFDLPFEVAGQRCKVGLTIGFALSPHDGLEANDLLKRADAAMYAGKQAGRHQLRRGAASPGLVT